MRPYWLCGVGLWACALGVAQTNDWLIVPGVRIGPVTASTSRADLGRVFGTASVTDKPIDMGDGSSRPGTVVHANNPSEALGIVWTDETQTRPDQVRVCYGLMRGPCRWHTADGIGIHTSLRELEKANGKPFVLLGFERDFAGTVLSWQGGKLEAEFETNGRLVIRLAPKMNRGGDFIPPLSPSEEAAVLAERIPSDHPAMRKLNPEVYRILFVFPRGS